METHEKRIVVLRRIIGDMLLKDFANKYDIDPSYLSQILNGHRNLGEKAARNMEGKIDLIPGTLENPDVEPSLILNNPPASQVSPIPKKDSDAVLARADYLSLLATPRSREIISRIVNAAALGRLTDSDIELLDQIARRFESAHLDTPEVNSAGSHKKLRERLTDHDPLPKT